MSDIHWQAWSDEVFAQARAEGKPVLLHIGATWCHWCHVMDEGTYPHPQVQRLVSERFVAIRVDTDHRPDINERYNQGGWPTCCILDGSGDVLVGRLYMPAHELIPLLESTSTPGQRWVIGKGTPDRLPEGALDLASVASAVKKAFDPYHGGFGELEKFPHAGVLDWLCDRAQRGDADARGMLHATLDAMVEKALFDPVDGGFHRYATRDDWQEVHYEKLLDDNARLLEVLVRAGVHRPAAEATARWMIRWLWLDEARAFGGSMDADERYYNESPRTEAPPVDRTVYAGWSATAAVALLRASAVWDRPGLAGLALAALDTLRAQQVREDGAVLRTRTGMAGLLEDQAAVARAFCAAAAWTGDAGWLRGAEAALGFAETLALPDDAGFRDGPATGIGMMNEVRRPLPANAALGEAALRLHALTADGRWRTLAERAAAGAGAEAARYGFMAAPAAALAERLAARTVVVKVHGDDQLFRQAWGLPDPDLVVTRATDGVPAGSALACSGAACARPVREVEGLREQIAMLRGA